MFGILLLLFRHGEYPVFPWKGSCCGYRCKADASRFDRDQLSRRWRSRRYRNDRDHACCKQRRTDYRLFHQQCNLWHDRRSDGTDNTSGTEDTHQSLWQRVRTRRESDRHGGGHELAHRSGVSAALCRLTTERDLSDSKSGTEGIAESNRWTRFLLCGDPLTLSDQLADESSRCANLDSE